MASALVIFLVLRSFDITNKYLRYLMLSHRFIDIVNNSTYGSKMPRANWEFIGDLEKPLPPPNEQLQIVKHIEAKLIKIDNTIAQAKQSIALIQAYKTTLINDAVSGKLKVSLSKPTIEDDIQQVVKTTQLIEGYDEYDEEIVQKAKLLRQKYGIKVSPDLSTP